MKVNTTTLEANKVQFQRGYKADKFVIKRAYITGIPQHDLAVERNGVKRYPMHWIITFECKKKRPALPPALPNEPTQTISASSRGQNLSENGLKAATHRHDSVTKAVKAAVAASKTHAAANTNSNATNNASISSSADAKSSATPRPPRTYFFRFDQAPPRKNFEAYSAKKDSVPVLLFFLNKEYAHSEKAPEWAKFSITVRKDITLGEYIKFVESKGRHRFLRTSTGSGCLHHVKTLLTDMVEVKIIDERSQGYKSVMGLTRGDVGDEYFIPGGEGTYF